MSIDGNLQDDGSVVTWGDPGAGGVIPYEARSGGTLVPHILSKGNDFFAFGPPDS